MLRTYSLSCSVDAQDCHRISVKREAGLNGAPDGVGSVWLHDELAEGAELEIAPPRGAFFLDEASERPVLLLAGGVGLTPLLSMLHRLSATERKVWFVHACEDGGVQALYLDLAERLVHTLRSVAANIGAQPVADRAQAVEQALRSPRQEAPALQPYIFSDFLFLNTITHWQHTL